jgi:hypothetical protein
MTLLTPLGADEWDSMPAAYDCRAKNPGETVLEN